MDIEPQRVVRPQWQKLGNLAAGAEQTFSVRLNSSNVQAYRVLAQWNGGERTFLTQMATALPHPEDLADGFPQLILTNPFFEYNKKKNRQM